MTGFLLRKMWRSKWLMICLLAGNILLVGIASATPMYSMATMTRMLQQDLRSRMQDEARYPVSSYLRMNFRQMPEGYRAAIYRQCRDIWAPATFEALGIPLLYSVLSYQMAYWQLYPIIQRETQVPVRSVNLWAVLGFAEHINLVYGRMPADELVEVNVIEVISTDRALLHRDLLYDELMYVSNVYDQDAGEPRLYVRVVGIFEVPEQSQLFWQMLEVNLFTCFLLSERLVYERFISDYHTDYRISAIWTGVHNFESMSAPYTDRYLQGIRNQSALAAQRGMSFDTSYYLILQEHVERAAGFSITLVVLQTPLYALLAFFVYVVSRKIMQIEQNDISVLKSRGASRWQILSIYLMQGALVCLLAYPLGILFGMGICRIFGASSGFLELAVRAPIVVELSLTALMYGVWVSLFSFLTMVLPVIYFSRVDIIEHKRNKSDRAKKSLWQRYFLDVICLGVSIYGIYNFHIQQELIGLALRDWIDPSLFVISSLFMVGFGLFCLRIFPYLMKLLFLLGRNILPISVYASLLKVARSTGEEQFIMVFLVFTMAVGIFNAQSARTIMFNTEHQVRYISGADFRFREHWTNNHGAVRAGLASVVQHQEPSIERFSHFDEVESMTRVLSLRGAVSGRGGNRAINQRNVSFLAIEPRGFGETAWFRDDVMRLHMNYYLNILAQVPNGALLSENFREEGMVLGSTIDISYDSVVPGIGASPPIVITNDTSLVVVGFVDRWPTYVPLIRENIDGHVIDLDRHILVCNRSFIYSQWGDVWPYEVWLRTNTETNDFFFDFWQENDLSISSFNDTAAEIAESRTAPLIQGTNGVLTVNFIAALLLCFIGFLIYWILSVKERVLQFGVFRAMGMSMRGIIGLLINEQLLISFTALLIGALVGEVTARLFVPLIQLAYTDQIIPLLVVMEPGDYANLYTVMGIMIIACLAVMVFIISKIRIDQALKLGED